MWPRVGSKETMWIDKAFPEKDALVFLTRWGTAWFPNHVRAVLSKIGESPEKSWFGNVWYLGSPWTMTYYDWLVVSNMAGLFYHGLFEGNHPQMDPWCWYINANMTGVYWWDPWHTIYNSTMDPSWVMGCHPKKPLTNSIILKKMVFLSTNQMIISFASTVCINRWSIGMIPSSMAEWACPD